MIQALVACRAGVGSSLMLKIKLNEVIAEHDLPVEVQHASLDGLSSFDGPIVVTLSDVADDLKKKAFRRKS